MNVTEATREFLNTQVRRGDMNERSAAGLFLDAKDEAERFVSMDEYRQCVDDLSIGGDERAWKAWLGLD
jgi:hypothetical protein